MQTAEAQAQRLEQVYQTLESTLSQWQKPEIAVPSADEWSVTEILGHTVEMIPFWLHHCRQIMASETPLAFGRSLDASERLAGVALGTTHDVAALLALLKPEVEQAAQQIRQMSESEREKIGVHPKRGMMRVVDVIEGLIVGHAEEHLAQLQAVLSS